MLLLWMLTPMFAQGKDASYQTNTIFDVRGIIWGFDWIDDDRILYTLREGSVVLYDHTRSRHLEIKNVPEVAAVGQGGMLDIRLHPQFATNKWVYLTYSIKKANAYETRLSRAKLNGRSFTDLEVLFTSQSGSPEGRHFGSRVVFDQKGHVFLSVGDRGQRDKAQDLSQYHGKVYRLSEDGRIPKDNPFVNQKNAIDAIWSYGHRNIQGLWYDKATSILWSHEHGPRGGDELNITEAGKNYGWPVITYGREYHGPKINEGLKFKEGMEQPEYYYIPSIAPSGLAYYEEGPLTDIKGAFLLGALAKQHLNVLIKEGSQYIEQRWLDLDRERIRNVAVRKGAIYVSTDTGKLIRLSK